MRFTFYKATAQDIIEYLPKVKVPADLKIKCWEPSFRSLYPAGLDGTYERKALILWWFLYKFFKRGPYKIFLIYSKTEVVHYTFLFSKNLRCPFMGSNDLKLGHTWTHKNYRGRGFAVLATNALV